MEFLLLLMMRPNLNDTDDKNSSLRPTFILQRRISQAIIISYFTHLPWFSSGLGAPVLKLSEHNKA